MTTRRGVWMLVLVLAVCGPWALGADAEGAKKLKVVVLTGGHGFDRKTFLGMFESFKDIEFKECALGKTSTIFDDISAWPYDVIVTYNMNGITEPQRENLLKLLDKGVGFVMMHHSAAAYQDWDEFPKISGCRYLQKKMVDGKAVGSTYKEGVEIKVHVENATHPVTAGVTDFVVHDEVYGKCHFEPDNQYMLSTDQPLSDQHLAWVRTYRKSNVCGLLLGHGTSIFSDTHFLTFVHNAMFWAAKAR